MNINKTKNCNIDYIGKKRNGDKKFWCLTHKVFVKESEFVSQKCSHCGKDVNNNDNKIEIFLEDYRGGVGVWSALNAIFTNNDNDENIIGVHIHTRKIPGGSKDNDDTFDKIIIRSRQNKEAVLEIQKEEAVAMTIGKLAGKKIVSSQCSYCGKIHLDQDWFAVNEHKKHLCDNCGRDFFVKEANISNPLVNKINNFFSQLDGYSRKKPLIKSTNLDINTKDFDSISIWVSNPAILWTPERPEEAGIHIHCYRDGKKVLDDTYGEVSINGYALPYEQARLLFVQMNLAYLENRVKSLICPKCEREHFDSDKDAFLPHREHICQYCKTTFSCNKKVVSNPLKGVLDKVKNVIN